MAEFCWKCWNKIHDTDAPKSAVMLSWERDFCEECEQWERVVVGLRWPEEPAAWLDKWKEEV